MTEEERKERRKQSQKKWREAHRAELAAYFREYRKEHREEERARKRRYYAENREKIRKQINSYRSAHPEYADSVTNAVAIRAERAEKFKRDSLLISGFEQESPDEIARRYYTRYSD